MHKSQAVLKPAGLGATASPGAPAQVTQALNQVTSNPTQPGILHCSGAALCWSSGALRALQSPGSLQTAQTSAHPWL